jgi:hypothetical protein
LLSRDSKREIPECEIPGVVGIEPSMRPHP